MIGLFENAKQARGLRQQLDEIRRMRERADRDVLRGRTRSSPAGRVGATSTMSCPAFATRFPLGNEPLNTAPTPPPPTKRSPRSCVNRQRPTSKRTPRRASHKIEAAIVALGKDNKELQERIGEIAPLILVLAELERQTQEYVTAQSELGSISANLDDQLANAEVCAKELAEVKAALPWLKKMSAERERIAAALAGRRTPKPTLPTSKPCLESLHCASPRPKPRWTRRRRRASRRRGLRSRAATAERMPRCVFTGSTTRRPGRSARRAVKQSRGNTPRRNARSSAPRSKPRNGTRSTPNRRSKPRSHRMRRPRARTRSSWPSRRD